MDYKYISFTNRKRYKESFNFLCDSIIFNKLLIDKYRHIYSGGFIVNNISVTTKLFGKKCERALFKENYEITPTKKIDKIRKEINFDGKIMSVDLFNGDIQRILIGKSTERWHLKPNLHLLMGKSEKFSLEYELENEFEYSNRWFYTIDAPTRTFRYRFIFSDDYVPKLLNVTYMQTQTTIYSKELKGRKITEGTLFEYRMLFPMFKDRFEFIWK